MTFEITGGDVHESQVAPLLIERLPHAEATVADKGYDSTSIRELIQSKGSKVVQPSVMQNLMHIIAKPL